MSTRTTIGAVVLAAALAGGAGALIGAPALAGAQSSGSTTTTEPAASTPTTPTAPSGAVRPGPGMPGDPSKGGHVGADGTTEALLTGTTADKVTAAAEAKVPDATVLRVETDAEGSPYEAHMTKSDGSQVTVKVDSQFSVTSVEAGF